MREIFDNGFDETDDFGPKELFRVFMEDAMNREAGKVAPDTTGADKYFIDGFFTRALKYDFWVIARDFMSHHFSEMSEFNKLASYMNGSAYQSDPEHSLYIRIFSIIYKAAKSGDVYSISLIKNLYKTYHKREYKQLKCFKKISVSEIFSLSESYDGSVEYEAMARILGMCSLYGIEMEDKCSILYIFLNRNREQLDEENEIEFYQFPDGVYQQCLEQIDLWMNEKKGNNDKFCECAPDYWKLDNFVARCLERFAYPEDFVFRCDYECYDQRNTFAQTLALLKSVYPKEEFSYEDVQKYAHIYTVVSALISVCDSYDENLNELFGISTDRHLLDGRECLYKPEPVVKAKPVQKEVITKQIATSPVTNGIADQEDYLREIAELRYKLHQKNEENKSLNMQYAHTKRELKETSELKQSDFELFRLLCDEARKSLQYFTAMRYTDANSFIIFLLSGSLLNPLPTHYYCERCGFFEEVKTHLPGIDLPEKNCPQSCRGSILKSESNDVG